MKTYSRLPNFALVLPLLLLLASTSAFGRARVQGWCEQGNQSVQTPGDPPSTTKVQRSYPGCTVNVYSVGTTTHVTIYSDLAGTAKGNPFTAATSTGYWFFYTDDPFVDVNLSGAGISPPFTLGSLPAPDPTNELSDGPFSTYAAACAAAVSAQQTLVVGRTWTALSTQSCAASERFTLGGLLRPASGQTVTLTGSLTAPLVQVFDTSASGAKIAFATGVVPTAYPAWWGAKGDGATDSTAAINAALAACNLSCKVDPGSGTYKVTDSLAMSGNGQQFCGEGGFVTKISWQGATPKSVIQMNGYNARICELYISNDIATGWIEAISYANGGTTSDGVIDHVFVECNAHPGNGISLGRLGVQGDQALVLRPEIVNCTSGYAIAALNANAVDNVIVSASLGNNWIGVQTTTSVNMSILGGSINDNGINFSCGFGGTCLIQGVRSENSNRSFFSSVGGYNSPVTFDHYMVNAIPTNRVATTTTTTAGQCGNLALTYTDDGSAESKFTLGDFIVIAGAGVAGADLHTQITSANNPHNMSVSGLLPCPSTSVSNTAVTLDGTKQQNNFEEHGGGTYIHRQVTINTLSGGDTFSRDSQQLFEGVYITTNTTNPFNIPSTILCPAYAQAQWTKFYSNIRVAQSLQADYRMNGVTDLVAVNAGAGSVNNALVAPTPLWCQLARYTGLRIQLNTGAFTLAAGVANTLTIGTDAEVIHGATNANLSNAVPANSIITLTWNQPFGAWINQEDSPAASAPTYTIPTAYTPTLSFGGATTGITYGRQNGMYSQTCNSLSTGCTTTAWFDIILTSKGSAVGTATISLPLTADGGHPDAGCSLDFYDVFANTVTNQMYGQIPNGASAVTLRRATGAGSQVALADTDFSDTTQLTMTCIFRH